MSSIEQLAEVARKSQKNKTLAKSEPRDGRILDSPT